MAGNSDIGIRLGIEGEKDFKNVLRDINQSFKVLDSEMKLVASEFDKQDKSVAAVTARNEVLNKAIDTQKDKISTLEAALRNASDSFGENDRRTQNWAIQLNNAKAELNNMEKELEKSAEEADNLGEELEQNLGGSEAVFQDYADHMQKIGEDAYKNMGVSQSQYLATANKMGALLQGSGLDVQKSAEITEKAMQRAADMVSVMGIDMQMFFENTEQYAGNFARESTETVSGSIGLF